jgi:hypothetical protein
VLTFFQIFWLRGRTCHALDYLPDDSPRCFVGNGIDLACAALWIGIAADASVWTKYDNNKCDERQANAHEDRAGLTQREDSTSEVEAPWMAMETMSRAHLHLSSVFKTVQVLRSGAKLQSTS